MARTRKKLESSKTINICNLCNKEIYEDGHVIVKTRRRTEIHLHNDCLKKYCQDNRKVV